jgi:hypothetical protein
MTSREIWELITARYKSESDDFIVSVGHSALPFPGSPVSIYNLPEIQAFLSLRLGDIRYLALQALAKGA